MVTKEKEPDIVQALPIESTVTLAVTGSFYEDVKRELGIDPFAHKKADAEFEDSLKRQGSSMLETVRVVLSTPAVGNRKEVSE